MKLESRSLARPRVLALLPSMLPSARIYTVRPLSRLAEQGVIEFEYAFEDFFQPKVSIEQVRRSDLVIFVRNDEQKFNRYLDEARLLNIPTVYDLDDNFWEIPTQITSGRYHRWPGRMHQMEHYLESVDLVRVYNPIVMEHVRRFNHSVVMATAGIDIHLVDGIEHQPSATGPVRIIYATGRGAKDQLYDLILPALERILKEYPQHVELVLWRECPDALKSFSNIRILPLETDYEKFIRDLTAGGYDIGLAPLFDDRFYISKTNTKFRDYGLCRIAGIYSNNPVYADLQDGVHGLLAANEPEAWYQAMRRLIEDRGLRKHIQDQAYQYVAERYCQDRMEQEWLEIIPRLTSQKQRFDPQREAASPFYGVRERPADDGTTRVQVGGREQVAAGFRLMDYAASPARQVEAISSLPDNTIDELMIVDQLETLPDLEKAALDIQRVCKHGARVVIYARYWNHQVHQANPSICQPINEHTPRYWTRSMHSRIYTREYASQRGEAWGLRGADEKPLDLRCSRMEFMYAPDSRGLSADGKRKARCSLINVCEHILFHLTVIKEPTSEEEILKMEQEQVYIEPPQATFRRYQEQIAALEAQNEELLTQLFDRENQIETLERKIRQASQEGLSASSPDQIEALQKSRLFRFALRFLNRGDAWDTLPASFDGLRQDNQNVRDANRGKRLQLSADLNTVPFIEYPITIGAGKLESVEFAVVFNRQPNNGAIGIELVDPHQQIVAHAVVPAGMVNVKGPTSFQFDPPVQTIAGVYLFRIFARNFDAGARVYEFRGYSLQGLGKLQTKPFMRLQHKAG